MSQKTALYQLHLSLGAKMVDFAGWQMPIHYGSQLKEHHTVRKAAGMFDVSHMGIIDIHGIRARDFLRFLMANDVAKLDHSPGRALYSCMLNEQGGIIDDLIITFVDISWYRIVVNAGTKERDLAWLSKHARSFAVQVELRDDLSMVAVQGPEALARVHAASPHIAGITQGLKRFESSGEGDLFVARTGYTGEDGYEIIMANEEIEELWMALIDHDVAPIGLAARDTLRLEAGMNLYGQDMDETTSPLVSGLAWTVILENGRQFIGRDPLEREMAAGITERLVGLVLQDSGVLRPHQRVIVEGVGEGETTSGSFSPTMDRSIGLARIPVADGDRCQVEIRGKRLAAEIVRPPFVRNGKVVNL